MNKNFRFPATLVFIIFTYFFSLSTKAQPLTPELKIVQSQVTYHSFEAIAVKNKVNLSWLTEPEKTNDHFEVERSYDQKEFTTIGIILGAENPDASLSQYDFRDGEPGLTAHNEVYYRLKYFDAAENFSYSIIKKVVMNIPKMNVQVMPNPYMDKLNVTFSSDAGGTAEVRLLSISGSLVKKIQSTIAPGYTTLRLKDLNSQAPGLYIVDVVVNGKVLVSQKIIKQ